MNLRVTFLTGVFFAVAIASARGEFLDEYKAAKEKGDAALEEFFKLGAERFADDPTYYSLKSTFLWKKAHSTGVVISTKPAGKGDFVLSDPKTGKAVGSIGPGRKMPDPKWTKDTVAVIREAIRKFPYRLDFSVGLANVFFETQQYDEVFATFEALCLYAEKHPKAKFEGRKGMAEIYEVIKVNPGHAIPDAIQTQCNRFWKFENDVGDENMRRLAELSAKHFPKRPMSWNMLAAYHSFKGSPEKALSCLEKAHQADPKDEIVLSNLARFAEKQGDKEKARTYYKKIIKETDSNAERSKAEQALKRLKD